MIFEFTNNHGTQTDHSKKCEQKTDQSQNSHQNKPKSRDCKTNVRSPLLSTQQRVSHITAIEQKETRMDYKNIEHLEKEDATAETLALTNRWKELVKRQDYKLRNGLWKK